MFVLVFNRQQITSKEQEHTVKKENHKTDLQTIVCHFVHFILDRAVALLSVF